MVDKVQNLEPHHCCPLALFVYVCECMDIFFAAFFFLFCFFFFARFFFYSLSLSCFVYM